MFRMIVRSSGVSNVFYEDTATGDEQKVLEPKLTLEENAAGKLSFTVPPTNSSYSVFGFIDGDTDNNTIDTWVDVYKENSMYWTGRIISRQVDFWRCVKVECEGILAVLNDTIQPPNHYQNITPRSFLEALLNFHNNRVNDNDRKIYLGNVTVPTTSLGAAHRYTNYETTLTCIIEKLVKNVGGFIRLRYDRYSQGGRWVLDYLANYDETNSQKIEFGKNLFEYSRSMSSADYCTVVIPRGKQLENGPYEALTPYLTVESVNGGDIHVSLTAADYGGTVPGGLLPQQIYGNIEKVVDFSDVEVPAKLLSLGKAWLRDKQFADMQLEVGAMDLHYAGAQYQAINIGNTVEVVSPPHGMDRLFPVTKMEVKLDTPEDAIFTLGKTSSVSMTSRSNSAAAEVQQQFANIPTEQRLTTVFRQEATDIIERATTGYINIIQNEETGAQELVFSKAPNYKDSVGVWRWTYNGLGWKPGLYDDDSTYTIAITNDGRINADFISTGTLIADIIKAGILTDQSGNQNFWFNLSTGEYQIRALDELIEDSQAFVTMTQLSQTSASIEARAAATYATINTANGLATRLSTAESNISINATSIESKVSLTDYTGATIASKINQSATSVVIQAAHISLAGKTIALTSDNITIDSTYFKVSKTGAITATSGTIGGFTIDGTSIHTTGTSGGTTTSGAIYLSNASSGFSRSIGGTNRSNLRLAIGANFAVGATGSLYASDAVIKGTVNATTLSSTNAQITGGYFRVTTNNKDDSRIELSYGTFKNAISPYGIEMTSGTASRCGISCEAMTLVKNSVRFLYAYSDWGEFDIRGTDNKSIFYIYTRSNGNVISKAKVAYGDLAWTGLSAENHYNKSISNNTTTNIVSLKLPSAGTWAIAAGARFVSNSVGRRVAILSTTSGSTSETDYGNSVYMPAVNGSFTECSISKIYVATSAETLYLNALQTSGRDLTVYASIRAVRIA